MTNHFQISFGVASTERGDATALLVRVVFIHPGRLQVDVQVDVQVDAQLDQGEDHQGVQTVEHAARAECAP
jgi:hypothetical protein